jgi:toxin HigB-1
MTYSTARTQRTLAAGAHRISGLWRLASLTSSIPLGSLEDLRIPLGNRLEALSGHRDGQYSIRINDQYRICFAWIDNEPDEVEIVDYH